jgi:hypothetical protein
MGGMECFFPDLTKENKHLSIFTKFSLPSISAEHRSSVYSFDRVRVYVDRSIMRSHQVAIDVRSFPRHRRRPKFTTKYLTSLHLASRVTQSVYSRMVIQVAENPIL